MNAGITFAVNLINSKKSLEFILRGAVPAEWMCRMKKSLQSLSSQFINDIDPYLGRNTVPAPLAVELDSDEAWQDFQETCASLDDGFADTQVDAVLN